MTIHCAVYAIRPGLKASMKRSVTKHVTMMIKDKLEEKMNKKGKNSQIIQLEKLNTFEIKNLFDNLGAEMGNDYYGVFECILG